MPVSQPSSEACKAIKAGRSRRVPKPRARAQQGVQWVSSFCRLL